MHSPLLYPSLLGFNVATVQSYLELLDAESPGYHIDIMDGQFVQTVAGDALLVNDVAAHSARQHQWVHLMVQDPLLYLKTFSMRQESIATFHIETNVDHVGVIKYIKEKKWRASIAISPKTPVAAFFNLAMQIDQVLLMSVEPGASGQPFLSGTFSKIEELIHFRNENGLTFRIGIDGGVNRSNIESLARMGVDDFALSSALFGSNDPKAALHDLKQLANYASEK